MQAGTDEVTEERFEELFSLAGGESKRLKQQQQQLLKLSWLYIL